MGLFRPVAPIDVLFLACVLLLSLGSVGYHRGRERMATLLAGGGWALFSLFWAATAFDYLTTSRYFLGLVGTVTVALAVYTTSLVARRQSPGDRLTVAFAVMGLVFVPYQFVAPIYRFVLASVAANTVSVLQLLGFEAFVIAGPQGYPNVIAFDGLPLSHSIRIVSACSGISAAAMFVGLLLATDAPRRRKYLASLGIVPLIYVLNIVRTALVAGSLGGAWFAPLSGVATALFGSTDPAMASYYVAEYLVAQTLVVLVLLGVYVRLTDWIPELQTFVGSVLDRASTDYDRLTQR